MDPIGFALENFDSLGQWRTNDGDASIDASGVLLDGTAVNGPAALRASLLRQKEQFVKAVTAKLLMYAIGRETASLRCPGGPLDCEDRRSRRSPVVVDHRRNCQERPVSDSGDRGHDSDEKSHLAPDGTSRSRRRHCLPLLDAMVPALTASQKTVLKPVRRLGIVYHPNGVVYENWLPKGVGNEFEFSRVLAPLERFRNRAIVVTGLADRQAEALGDGAGDHSRASGSYLTGVHIKKSDSQVQNGISMDQIAARAFEGETQLSSLELTVDATASWAPATSATAARTATPSRG